MMQIFYFKLLENVFNPKGKFAGTIKCGEIEACDVDLPHIIFLPLFPFAGSVLHTQFFMV